MGYYWSTWIPAACAFLDLPPALAVVASSKPAVRLAAPLLPWNTCPDNCFVLSATACLINVIAVLEIFLTCSFAEALIVALWPHYTEGRTQLSSSSPQSSAEFCSTPEVSGFCQELTLKSTVLQPGTALDSRGSSQQQGDSCDTGSSRRFRGGDILLEMGHLSLWHNMYHCWIEFSSWSPAPV